MVLKSVGVLSAGKIMGVLGAIGGLIGGAMLAIISLLGGAAQMAQIEAQVQAQNGVAGNPAAPTMFLGVGAIVFLPIMYGIFGFIAGMIYAAIYNVAAGIIGGLEVDLQPKSP